jgi:hypothetical protein
VLELTMTAARGHKRPTIRAQRSSHAAIVSMYGRASPPWEAWRHMSTRGPPTLRADVHPACSGNTDR